MTPDENRAAAADTFRTFVWMLSDTTSHVVGWHQVALVLAECASDAMARAAEQREPPHP